MAFTVRIDYERQRSAGRSIIRLVRGRTVGPSARTAVGIVTELVNVHASLRVAIVALEVVGDGRGAGLATLLKGDGARDVGVTANDCDCCGETCG